MLEKTTILSPQTHGKNQLNDTEIVRRINDTLKIHGYCLLRAFQPDNNSFNQLMDNLCSSVTFDPARQNTNNNIQKVDAGTAAIGLHIENGNTPNIPEMVAFFCRKAARQGSRTTLCDGASLWNLMCENLQAKLNQPVTVTRTLQAHLWKAYLANEHPLLSDSTQVTAEHLQQMIASRPGQHGELHEDGSLTFSLTLSPVRTSKHGGRPAFANAILGPSFGYEPPRYRFADDTEVSNELKREIEILAESITIEIPWQNGDIAIIDNWRVMHGRREILDTEHREVFIGMGNL